MNMGESLADRLVKVSNLLHWLGRYDEANSLMLICRLLRDKRLESVEELEAWINQQDANE